MHKGKKKFASQPLFEAAGLHLMASPVANSNVKHSLINASCCKVNKSQKIFLLLSQHPKLNAKFSLILCFGHISRFEYVAVIRYRENR